MGFDLCGLGLDSAHHHIIHTLHTYIYIHQSINEPPPITANITNQQLLLLQLLPALLLKPPQHHNPTYTHASPQTHRTKRKTKRGKEGSGGRKKKTSVSFTSLSRSLFFTSVFTGGYHLCACIFFCRNTTLFAFEGMLLYFSYRIYLYLANPHVMITMIGWLSCS